MFSIKKFIVTMKNEVYTFNNAIECIALFDGFSLSGYMITAVFQNNYEAVINEETLREIGSRQ